MASLALQVLCSASHRSHLPHSASRIISCKQANEFAAFVEMDAYENPHESGKTLSWGKKKNMESWAAVRHIESGSRIYASVLPTVTFRIETLPTSVDSKVRKFAPEKSGQKEK